MEEQLTRGLSGVSRDIFRSWQSLTTSLPQAAVTDIPLQAIASSLSRFLGNMLIDLQRDRVRVPLTAPKNILLSVHLVTLSINHCEISIHMKSITVTEERCARKQSLD